MATVVPRHGQNTPNVSVPLKGYGLQRGAIAHSVSHDSHNILVTGRSDSDMLLAVETLKKVGGGFALIDTGEVVSTVPLPFAGLMTFEEVPELSQQIEAFNSELAARGVSHASSRPMMILVGLSLAVIPAVRVTDIHPLFDVAKQEAIPMFP
jgi:adenine deaminase